MSFSPTTNPPLTKIQHTTSSGHSLHATRVLSPGTSILAIQHPFLTTLDTAKLPDTCYTCHRQKGTVPVSISLGFGPAPSTKDTGANLSLPALKRCAGCKVVWYCSKPCQKASWASHHALECPVFAAVEPRVPPSHVRAVLRVVLLRRQGRVSEGDWAALMGCEAHRAEFERVERREVLAELKRMVGMVVALTGFEVDVEEVLGLFMRLKINSLTLQTPFHDPLGLVLHPTLAKVNHSCDPNCYVRFPEQNDLLPGSEGASPGLVVLTPLRNIRPGEEITISYVDETMPVRYRKQELEERYFFMCTCSKCVREEQSGTQLDEKLQMYIWRTQDKLRKVVEADEQTLLPEVRIAQLTSHVRALFDGRLEWPLSLYPFPQLLHQLILAHIDAQNTQSFAMACRLAMLLHHRVDPAIYPSSVHPIRLVHTLLLVKLTNTVIDQISQTQSSRDPIVVQLTKNVNLDFMSHFHTQILMNSAVKTWMEQPWPWLHAMFNQSLQQAWGPGGMDAKMVNAENQRILQACAKTLEMLKNKP